MTHKFTADGRKVAVIGALNAKETIVQEVFVADGTEFPAGEHFIAKTLLDSPAETYKAREEKRIEESIKRLEQERDRLSREIDGFRFKAKAAAAKARWIEGVTEPEVQEVLDNLTAMLCGEYTHVLFPTHDMEIKEWDERLFSRSDSYNYNSFESLRLISLFGEWNGRLSLNWKVNTYCDGSGSSACIIPCKSSAEAIAKAAQIINGKEHLSDKDHDFCIKYGIPVDPVKNEARLTAKAENVKRRIAETKAALAKLECELATIGGKEGFSECN